MKVLIYENRKIDPIVFGLGDTKESELAGFMKLFLFLRDEWMVYTDLTAAPDLDERPSEKRQREAQLKLYLAANDIGDAVSAKKLLEARRHDEYQHFSVAEVQ